MFSLIAPLLATLVEILIALLVIASAYIKWNHQYWRRRKVPYLEPSFPMGHMNLSYFDKDPVGVQMQKIYNRIKAKGLKHCGLYIFSSPTYMPLDLDYVKNIMTKDFQYFTDRGTYYNEKDDPLSAHLFAIGGLKWRNLRTKLSPTFTSGKMKHMFQTLLECEIPLIKAMDSCAQQQEAVNIKDVFARFTTNIIGSCAFGLECNSFQEQEVPLRTYGKKIFDVSLLRNIKITFVMTYQSLSRALHLRFIPTDVADFFMKLVKDTVAYREKNQVKRNDFLQLLMEMKGHDDTKHDGTTLTMNELAAQCFVFFLAGFETSSTTSTFLLYEVAKHQKIQEKVRQEIEEVLERYDGNLTYDAINDMKYMDQVIDEVLRKYPALPFITRQCVKDYPVPNSDVVLEKGTLVVVPVLGIHMDPEYFPDPDKFDPERFSDANKYKRHPYAHMPFGEGPRICIGMRFGLLQTKVGLTALIRNYKFTVSRRTKEPLTLVPTALIPAVEGDLWLDIEKIEN